MRSNSGGELAIYLVALYLLLFGWSVVEFLSSLGNGNSYFPPEYGWLEETAAAVGCIGPVLGLGIFAIPLVWARKTRYFDYDLYRKARSITQSEPPSDLQPAVVSVLEGRKVTTRTLIATLFEMCKRGELRVNFEAGRTSEGEVEYDVKWSPGSGSTFGWENKVRDALGMYDFDPGSDAFRKGLGRQLSEHLQSRGLFRSDPLSEAWWVNTPWIMGPLSFGVALIAWIALSGVHWFNGAVIVITLFTLYLVGLGLVWPEHEDDNIRRAGKVKPTENGLQEIVRWLAFKRHLREMNHSEGARKEQPRPYPFASYALALGEAEEWMFDGITDSLQGEGQVYGAIGKGDAGQEANLDHAFMGWLRRTCVSEAEFYGALYEGWQQYKESLDGEG